MNEEGSKFQIKEELEYIPVADESERRPGKYDLDVRYEDGYLVEEVELQQQNDGELDYTASEYCVEFVDGSGEIDHNVVQESFAASDTDLNTLKASSTNNTNNNHNSNYSKKRQSILKRSLITIQKSAISSSSKSSKIAYTTSSVVLSGSDVQLDQALIDKFISQQTTRSAWRNTCNLCRKEFKTYNALQKHVPMHSNWIRSKYQKKFWQCELCLRNFQGPGSLEMHMGTHRIRSYSCGKCRSKFYYPSALSAHVSKKHPEVKQPKYKCGRCSIVYDDIDILQTHLKTGCHTSHSVVSDSGGGFFTNVVTLQNGQRVKFEGIAKK